MIVEEKRKDIELMYKKINNRERKEGCFYKLSSYNSKVEEFLVEYFSYIHKNGIYIKDNLENPTQDNINYFLQFIGNDFTLNEIFLEEKLKKWLLQLDSLAIKILAKAMYQAFLELKKRGKNESILKNVYIRYMCWSYYKFQYIIISCFKMTEVNNPKILIDFNLSQYEVFYFEILSKLGCDVLVIEKGDNNVNNDIPQLEISNSKPIPIDYSIDNMMKKIVSEKEKSWINGKALDIIVKEISERVNPTGGKKNVFALIEGVENKETYFFELYKLKNRIEAQNRKIIIIEDKIPNPEFEEVNKIVKPEVESVKGLALSLAKKIFYSFDLELTRHIQNEYINILLENSEDDYRKVLNRGMIILCWLNRYVPQLLELNTTKFYPVFIFYGNCKNSNEKIFLRLLAKLNIDVLIINSDRNRGVILEDDYLYREFYQESLEIVKFPKTINEFDVLTVASKAQKELEKVLYKDTGLYRLNQYKSAVPVSITTTYEEISILWSQEAKYRPNFEVIDDKVVVPTICAKILGVDEKNINKYWRKVENFIRNDGIIVINKNIYDDSNSKKIKNITTFIENGKLIIEKIKNSAGYKYAFLNEDKQNYILEKINYVITQNNINGKDFINADLIILQTLLNLDIKILRLIQNYDFTKQIPKLVIINSNENIGSIEDAIIIAFLKEIGFDILLILPTGYRTVEYYYNNNIFNEHQVGSFRYDLKVPKFNEKTRKFQLSKILVDFKSMFNI